MKTLLEKFEIYGLRKCLFYGGAELKNKLIMQLLRGLIAKKAKI